LKKLLKRLFVPVLASRSVTALATRLFGYGIPIFMLHRMAPDENCRSGKINPSHLRRCLQYLVENRYSFISVEQLILALGNGQPLPPKSVVFTMDDGYTDQARVAAPIFLEFGCPLTFFVITGMLDQTLWPWDAKIAWIMETTKKTSLKTRVSNQQLNFALENEESRRQAKHLVQDIIRETDPENIPMILSRLSLDADVTLPDRPPDAYSPITWDTARRLEGTGIQFAPHSVTHNTLSRLRDTSLDEEIKDSWQTLKNELANPLKVFCYPTGRAIDFGGREIEALARNGFLGAVATTPGFIQPEDNPDKQLFRLHRFALPESMDDFIQYCTWIEYVKHRH